MGFNSGFKGLNLHPHTKHYSNVLPFRNDTGLVLLQPPDEPTRESCFFRSPLECSECSCLRSLQCCNGNEEAPLLSELAMLPFVWWLLPFRTAKGEGEPMKRKCF